MRRGRLWAALAAFGAFLAYRASTRVWKSGDVELLAGVRYLFTYISSRPVTLEEVAAMLELQPVTALSVGPLSPGYWQVSFEASPSSSVRARIGNPILPEESQIRLSEVERLG